MNELEFLCAIGKSDLKEDTIDALMQLFRRIEKLEGAKNTEQQFKTENGGVLPEKYIFLARKNVNMISRYATTRTIRKRSKRMTKQGDRVGAIQSTNSEEVMFYGYGVYEGDTIPPNFPIPNPTIKLDNGKTVYGYECWWGPEAHIKELIGNRKVTEVFPNREFAEQRVQPDNTDGSQKGETNSVSENHN